MRKLVFGLACVGVVAVLVEACGSSPSSKQVAGEAGGQGGAPEPTGGGGGSTAQAGVSAGAAGASESSGGASESGASGEANGGAGESSGGASDRGGAGGQAGAATDAGAGGQSDACGTDGEVCALADSSGVCCQGACVGGDCCGVSDCPSDGYVCDDHQCKDVAGSLSGLLWELPCTSPSDSVSCYTNPSTTVTTTLGGATGVTYDVTLRFRGVVEQKTYTGGCSDGAGWQSAGAENGDTYNVYELDISSPPQRYFLNVGSSNITHSWAVDFQKTIRIDAGATVTLYAASKDNAEILNLDAGAVPISIDGTSVTQPYDGQFVQMDVLSVTPDAVASSSSSGGSSGSALSFGGGQYATVARSAALEPTSLTQEAWFNLAAASGVYNALFGKTYGGGSADSYTIWYQGGTLLAGVNLNSPTGAASVAWNAPQEWHHAAASYDATSGRETLYIDGFPVACPIGSGAVAYDTHALVIGADIENGSPNGFWNGQLDELRLFSTARTADQVWADMHTHQLGPTPGLAAEWTFDEGSGQTAADSSGNGNDAVLGSTNAVESADPAWTASTLP